MTSFSSRGHRQRGFTLLELIVVILLVSLLTGLIMQGVLYVGRQYAAVERQQLRIQAREYLRGWVSFSVTGLINGFDGDLMPATPFRGNESGFSAITLSPLASTRRGIPHLVQWRIDSNQGQVRLQYGERAFNEQGMQWYTLRVLPDADIRWSYFAQGRWQSEFPPSDLPLGFDVAAKERQVLPDLIGLEIDMANARFEQIVAIKADTTVYRPPSVNE